MLALTLQDEHFFFLQRPVDAPIYFRNVIEYSHIDFTSISITVVEQQPPIVELPQTLPADVQLYIVVDTTFSDNFGHFFWECLIFLPQLEKIRKQYPEVIFLIKNNKKFKSKIFTHYLLNYDTSIRNSNNVVGFLPLITSLNTNKYSNAYEKLLDKFHYDLTQDVPNFDSKKYEIVYFPRHKVVDNYPYEGQDRDYDDSEILNYVAHVPNSKIIYSEDGDSWKDEIEAVRNAKILIVQDGSSATVLGFHAQNSLIIVLNHNISLPSMARFEKTIIFEKIIRRTNSKYFVSPQGKKFILDDLMPLISQRITCAKLG
ncbi:hypothetical protein MCEMSE6_02938 [Oxalobacteraceae bacterium]